MRDRLLTLGPDHETLWVRLYVQPYADYLAAMLVGDAVPPPDPFFGAIRDAVDGVAQATVEQDHP